MSFQADKDLALQLHNQARAAAPGPNRQPLVWSATLEAAAYSYAQKLVHLSRGLPHSAPETRPGQGENLSWCSGDHSLSQATKMWINEIKDYRGAKFGEDKAMVGHYTQVVWPGSLKVGIARATGRSGETYVVARYSPPGNWMGESPWGNFRGRVDAPRMDHVQEIGNWRTPQAGNAGVNAYIQPIYDHPKMGEVVQGVKKVVQKFQKRMQEKRQGQQQGQMQQPRQVQQQGGAGGGADHQWVKNVMGQLKNGVQYEYKEWQNRKQARK